MGIVIVGGNECMVCQYEKICKQYGCKAKVFAKESGSFKKQVRKTSYKQFSSSSFIIS